MYLADLPRQEGYEDPVQELEKSFEKTKWFKRGWTLQEIAAPESVVLFDRNKEVLEGMEGLATVISRVTGVSELALTSVDLSRYGFSESLSWAKYCHKTVPEDAVYCRIGIFDVELHVLYVEGEYGKRMKGALNRLHRAIAEANVDIEQPKDVVRIGGASSLL